LTTRHRAAHSRSRRGVCSEYWCYAICVRCASAGKVKRTWSAEFYFYDNLVDFEGKEKIGDRP
jgi:hypothetical protein